MTATVDVPVALDVLGRANYVLLTTFRKTGAPVPTPVWAVRSGDELLVWSNPVAGKVKRIRNSGRVELAPCTARGEPLGRSIDAWARLLSDSETRLMLGLLVRKYGVLGFFTTLGPRYFGVPGAGIGITIPAGESFGVIHVYEIDGQVWHTGRSSPVPVHAPNTPLRTTRGHRQGPIERGSTMKSGIHPAYVTTEVACGCGNHFTTRSTETNGKINVEVCSNCHPFYTGKQKILDTGGRVARFEARYGKRSR